MGPPTQESDLLGASLSIHVVRSILWGAAQRGLDADAHARAVGLSPALLVDPDARVSARLAIKLWDDVARASRDPHFGLRLGEAVGMAGLNLAGQILAASATLAEGFRRILAYARVFNDAHEMHWTPTDDGAVLWYTARDLGYAVPYHAMEFAFAWSIVTARALTGGDASPTEVRFEHGPTGDGAEHARIFRCPARFHAERYEIHVSNAVLALPVKTANADLAEILDSHAKMLLARLPPRALLVDRVRTTIARGLPVGRGALDDVARELHVSPRSLQRKLRDEGSSYNEVLDEVRHAVATQRLGESDCAVNEVAFALGFSDPSAFHKAFVRWTGSSPGQWRRARRAP